MKNKTLLTTVILATIAATAVACGGDKGQSSEQQPQFNKEELKYDAYEYTTNYRNLRIMGTGYMSEPFTAVTKTVDQGKPTETTKTKYVVSDVGAFVVPVQFSDYPASSLPKGEEGSRKDIEDAVFGNGSETGWESLKSYYNKSSYGQCNITGVVTPWFMAQQGPSSTYFKMGTDGSDAIGREIYEYYTTGAGAGTYDMKDYDKNGDGHIDSLIMIYTPPITTTGELWWAFCSSMNSGEKNPEQPSFYRFFWASYRFFYESVYENGKQHVITDSEITSGKYKPDPHTLCHEFGHVLSLPDYYVTDYGNDYAGIGCLDMMDNNIGDHNAMSKTFYGWIEPYVIADQEKATTITINSTTDTGEYVVVPLKGKTYTTALDQYMMVEFLTPTGVAKHDGEVALRGSYPKYYSEAGVRISLIDARLGIRRIIGNEYKFSSFTTRIGTGQGMYVTLACTNTNSTSCYAGYKLIEIIPATGKAIKQYPGKPQNKADNTCLYQEGQVFGANGLWENFNVHSDDGTWTTPFGYTISIDKINGNENCTLTITPVQ